MFIKIGKVNDNVVITDEAIESTDLWNADVVVQRVNDVWVVTKGR